jgi:hypothetical protein
MSGRLPQLKPDDLDPTQRDFYGSLVANEVPWVESAGARAIGNDGSLLGPSTQRLPRRQEQHFALSPRTRNHHPHRRCHLAS